MKVKTTHYHQVIRMPLVQLLLRFVFVCVCGVHSLSQANFACVSIVLHMCHFNVNDVYKRTISNFVRPKFTPFFASQHRHLWDHILSHNNNNESEHFNYRFCVRYSMHKVSNEIPSESITYSKSNSTTRTAI